MPQHFETNFDAVVKTNLYERLRSSLLNDISPVFLTGPAGSGKTTLLELLARERASAGAPVCLISLREVLRESDLVSLVMHGLADAYANAKIEKPQVIASSGGQALQSVVEIIRALDVAPLILLDGFDETLNSQLILRFVRLVAKNTRALVVVAGRRTVAVDMKVFKEVLAIRAFTQEEIEELIERTNPRIQLNPATKSKLYDITRGSPLFAKLLVSQLDKAQGIFGEAFLIPDNILEIFLKRRLETAGLKDFSSAVRLLVVLALRDSLARSEIADLGFDTLEGLMSLGLLIEDRDRIRLVHKALETPILLIGGVLPAAGTRLQDLQFGAEEAERDKLLDENFIHLPGYTDIVLGKKNIVVGDRGTGKSAMFSQLEISNVSTSSDQTPRVVPVSHPAEMLKKLEANDSELRTAEQFRAGWLTLAAYFLAVSLNTFSSNQQKRAAARLRQAFSDNDETSSTSLKILKRLWKWRSSVKIRLGPILIEPAAMPNKGRQGGAIIDLSAFIRDAAKIFKESNQSVIIALDQIDEIHKYDRALQEKAVQGLFLAEGDLAQISGVNFLVFIRSDLFKIYDIQEKNKLVSRTLNIIWNKQDLLQFLVDRVLGNECLAGLRNFIREIPRIGIDVAVNAILPDQIEDTPAIDWLWESLENGNGNISPRQLILLLVLAVQSPAAHGFRVEKFPVFPAGALQSAMDQLSELSFKELVDDFRVARTFLSNCRAGKIDSFNLDRVKDLFSEDDGPTSLQIDLLERLGFLERVVVQRSDGQKSTEFRVPKLFNRCWAVS